jgi:hypothetical protein
MYLHVSVAFNESDAETADIAMMPAVSEFQQFEEDSAAYQGCPDPPRAKFVPGVNEMPRNTSAK